MASIRLVLVTMTPLDAGIITDLISNYARIDIVGDFVSRAEAEISVSDIAPDLILIGVPGEEADVIARAFLGLAPFAKVIVISTDASGASLYEAGAHRLDLRRASSQEFIKAVLGVSRKWVI